MKRPARLASILITVTLLSPLFGCEKKEPRPPEPAVDAVEQTQTYSTTQDVRVRSGAGTRHKIIAEIKSGTLVHVAGRENGWLKVVSKQGNPPGYIDERFAKPVGVPARSVAPASEVTYTTIADAYVREGPGLHYKAVAKVDRDTIINVVDENGDWLKVQSKRGNPPGYIEKKYAARELSQR
jgi:mannosyl-glycoprotein endo-beta-N-acetylglucosaminidase